MFSDSPRKTHYKSLRFWIKILSILCSKYGNPIYFLLHLGKMFVFGPYIFKVDGKRRDLFIYFSDYMVCNFANENKEQLSTLTLFIKKKI